MPEIKENRNEAFVNFIFQKVHQEKNAGFAAKMKKADSETTEVQSWELLARWTNIENRRQTKIYGLIGSAVARSKSEANGNYGLGKALLFTIADKTEIEKSSAAARLRRILACQDGMELVRILRPTLRYLESKEVSLDYSRLLEEILWFDNDASRDRTRARWAGEFFTYGEEE